MNNEQFQDLKQFIEATVSQSEARLEQRMDGLDGRIMNIEQNMATKQDLVAVDARLNDMDLKLDEIQNAVGESLQNMEDVAQDHDRRITRLERRAA